VVLVPGTPYPIRSVIGGMPACALSMLYWYVGINSLLDLVETLKKEVLLIKNYRLYLEWPKIVLGW
jgi:hypothetical protein